MATLPGRIRRISLDGGNPENFGFQATTTYADLAPALSATPWSAADSLVVDQALSEPIPPAGEVTGALGCLITFNRFPEYFGGVVVRVRPTYDTDAGEDPYLEFWTHDSVELEWRQRRSVQLRNGFVGCPTGKTKYFDFRTAEGLQNIDKCWVTLKPGGTATINWLAVHVFGTCRNVPVTDGNCEFSPTIDCIPSDPCVDEPETCLVPVQDCADLDPSVCDIPPFDWPKLPPPNNGPIPPPEPPELPIIDLCSAAEVAAYKESLTPEQLAFFTEMLDAAELPCLDPTKQPDPVAPINADPDGEKVLPKQPIEVYTDPKTLTPENDPKKDPPGGHAPGGTEDTEFHFAFIPGAFAQVWAEADLTVHPQIIQDAYAAQKVQYVLFGADAAVTPNATTAFARLRQINFKVSGLSPGCLVGVETYMGQQYAAGASRWKDNDSGDLCINVAGYFPAPQGGIFQCATPEFGIEGSADGGMAGMKTFLRLSSSQHTATLGFSVENPNNYGNPASGGYMDGFLITAYTEYPADADPLTVAIVQSSDVLTGIYFRVTVRHPKLQFSLGGDAGKVRVVPTVTAGYVDNRPLILGSSFCVSHTCTAY